MFDVHFFYGVALTLTIIAIKRRVSLIMKRADESQAYEYPEEYVIRLNEYAEKHRKTASQ